MKDNLCRFTLRIDRELLDKFGYVAEYEGRTKNRELEQLMKRRVAEFEREFGPIELETTK
ncbi:MAG: TraY domain-containing protein [Candidatus Faecousia sp.]|nr:TraY domain-containing protein [Clostridiales bacterium]MDD7652782.1 TraY domain-containing protein [Bacillota bacterium]MDY4219269.1 TraY domain-containing protein [Candidatus Faecousia sp.]